MSIAFGRWEERVPAGGTCRRGKSACRWGKEKGCVLPLPCGTMGLTAGEADRRERQVWRMENRRRRNAMSRKLKNMGKALKMELREHKSSFLVYVTLRLAMVAVAVLQFWNGNYENVFLCILSLMLLVIPSAMQLTFQVELPPALEIFILLFIFAAEILGEIGEFYLRFPFWDAVLHTVNGFLCAAIGFSLVTLLNNNQKIVFNLSPVFMAIVAVSFSMTIGVIWEFFEFGMDQIFGLDMQKDTVVPVIRTVLLDPEGRNVPYVIDSITRVEVNGRDLGLGGYLDIGLIDTMQDLLVTFAGSLVFSVLGFFYVKSRGKGALVSRFVPRRKDRDREFLRIVEEEERKNEQSE